MSNTSAAEDAAPREGRKIRSSQIYVLSAATAVAPLYALAALAAFLLAGERVDPKGMHPFAAAAIALAALVAPLAMGALILSPFLVARYPAFFKRTTDMVRGAWRRFWNETSSPVAGACIVSIMLSLSMLLMIW